MAQEAITGYTAKYIAAGEVRRIAKLLRGAFGDSYYGADSAFMRWLYFESPYKDKSAVGADEYSILVLLDEKEKILALDAFLPWVSFVSQKALPTVWDIEWLNPSCVRGAGREIVGLLRGGTEIYCGFGMNELSKKAYGKLGFPVKAEIERRVAILDAGKCLSLFGDGKVKGQADFLRGNEAPAGALRGTRYRLIKEAKGVSERYWESHLKRFPATSSKELKALEWRYLKHPYVDYSIIALDPRAESGLAVVRIEPVKGSTEKVLRILELFPVAGRERDLSEAVLRFGADQSAVLADFFCVSAPGAAQIAPEPFVGINEHRRYEIPMLFQPVEVRKRKSINMVLEHKVEGLSFDNFYATKGDGDQDVRVHKDHKTASL